MPKKGEHNGLDGTARLRAINEEAKAAADVILENLAAKKAGRPPKYHPGFVHIAATTAVIGATLPQLADIFGVWGQTLHDWCDQYPEFHAAIEKGRTLPDDMVEMSLFRRAMGYSHRSEKIFQYEGEIIRAETVEHYPPDTGAMAFWLKNRRPDKWRDRIDAPGATPEEAARVMREQAKEIEDKTIRKEKKK